MDDFEVEHSYDPDDFEDVPTDGSAAFEVESWVDPNMSTIKSLWEWGVPDMTPLKIAVIGAGGTGKRKLASALAQELDIPCINSISRTAHNYGAKLNKKGNWEDEFMIFLAQLWEQGEYDEFVTSSSVIETVAYADYFAMKSDDPKHIKMLCALTNVARTICHNDYEVFFYLPLEGKGKGDGVRSVDLKFQRDIDASIRYYLNAFDVDYLPVQGTLKERTEICVSYMKEYGLLSDR